LTVRLCDGQQSRRALTQNTNQPLYGIRFVALIKNCILMLRPSSASLSICPSTTWRIKTYKRSTMRTERLSGLALLHAYGDRTIDTDKFVQEFCAKKSRVNWNSNFEHLSELKRKVGIDPAFYRASVLLSCLYTFHFQINSIS